MIRHNDSNSKILIEEDGRAVLYACKSFVLRHDHLSHVPVGVDINIPNGYIGYVSPTWDLMHGKGAEMITTKLTGYNENLTLRMTSRQWKHRSQVKIGTAVAEIVLLPFERLEITNE